MRRRRLLAVVLGLGLLLAACGGDEGDDPGSGSGASGDGEHVITIEGSAFSGADSVPAGSTITVENEDDFQHTFTPDEDGAFEGASLDGGSSATVEAPEPGTYAYHCEIHPSMKGSFTVEAA